MNWIDLLVPIFEMLVVIVVIVVLIHKYADKQRTPIVVLLLTGLGWFLGFSMIVFIPLDVLLTVNHLQVVDWLIWWWMVFYWGSLVLNWTIMPFAIGYVESGHFTTTGKIWNGITNDFPFLAMSCVCFGLLCTLLYLTEYGKETLAASGGLTGVIIGLNMTVSLVWLSLVVGYGLVKIPQSFCKKAGKQKRLRYYQYKVSYYDQLITELLFLRPKSIRSLLIITRSLNVTPGIHQRYKQEMILEVKNSLQKAE